MMIFGADVPFAGLCAIEEVDVTDGVTRLRMAPGPDHRNNYGIVHGGALCTLLDVAMGSAARLKAACPVVTIDMQVSFLSAGRGVLFGEGRVLRAGRTLMFGEGEVRDEGGDLIAKATGLFRPVPVRREPGEANDAGLSRPHRED